MTMWFVCIFVLQASTLNCVLSYGFQVGSNHQKALGNDQETIDIAIETHSPSLDEYKNQKSNNTDSYQKNAEPNNKPPISSAIDPLIFKKPYENRIKKSQGYPYKNRAKKRESIDNPGLQAGGSTWQDSSPLASSEYRVYPRDEHPLLVNNAHLQNSPGLQILWNGDGSLIPMKVKRNNTRGRIFRHYIGRRSEPNKRDQNPHSNLNERYNNKLFEILRTNLHDDIRNRNEQPYLNENNARRLNRNLSDKKRRSDVQNQENNPGTLNNKNTELFSGLDLNNGRRSLNVLESVFRNPLTNNNNPNSYTSYLGDEDRIFNDDFNSLNLNGNLILSNDEVRGILNIIYSSDGSFNPITSNQNSLNIWKQVDQNRRNRMPNSKYRSQYSDESSEEYMFPLRA